MFIKWTLAIIVFITAILVVIDDEIDICKVNAANPLDFCFQHTITITNNGTTNYTNKLVRVEFDSLSIVNAGQLDARAWDYIPVADNLNDQLDFYFTNFNSANTKVWFYLDSLAAGETKNITIYHGNPSYRIDNGFIANGYSSPLTVPDALEVDFGADSSLFLILTLLDITERNEEIINKHDGSAGYAISLIDNSGTSQLRVTVDGSTCDYTLTTNDLGRHIYRFYLRNHVDDDILIHRDGVQIHACDVDEGFVDSNAEDLVIANGLTGAIIHLIEKYDNTLDVDYRYGFDATSLSESSFIANISSGTFFDYSGNGYDGTFTFTDNQDDFAYNVGIITQVNLDNFPTSSNINELYPNIVPPSLSTPASTVAPGGIVGDIRTNLDTYSTGVSINPDGPKVAMLYLMGLGLAIITFIATKFPPLTIVALCTPPIIGAMGGWYNPLWALILVFAVPVTWFATSRLSQPSP